MSDTTAFLAECLTIPEWSRSLNKSPAWGYLQVDRGLPVVKTGARKGYKVHPGEADKWYRARLSSTRKPAPTRQRKSGSP